MPALQPKTSLALYLHANGRRADWLAEQIGISKWRMYRLLAGDAPFYQKEVDAIVRALDDRYSAIFPTPPRIKEKEAAA